MDAESIPDHHDSACGRVLEPGSGGAHAFVFAATCPALVSWGGELGFDVVMIGVDADPLEAVQRLSDDDHGRGGMVLDEIIADPLPWGEWALVPVFSSIPRSVAVRPWGGALKVRLVPGAHPAMLRRRLRALLTPLDAHHAAVAPGVSSDRSGRSALPPAMPRYTRGGTGWVRAEGIYRWSSEADAHYASRAVVAAVGSLVFAEHELDLIGEAVALG